jgi:hypothetical protein
MAVGEKSREPMAPVHLFSHGTTMMLGEEHASAKYWEQCGDEALANGIEHVVIMVSNSRAPPLPTSANSLFSSWF